MPNINDEELDEINKETTRLLELCKDKFTAYSYGFMLGQFVAYADIYEEFKELINSGKYRTEVLFADNVFDTLSQRIEICTDILDDIKDEIELKTTHPESPFTDYIKSRFERKL